MPTGPVVALLPNCGFLSETSRMRAIAQALARHGARPVIASHGGPYDNVLGEPGVSWQKVAPVMTAAEHRSFLDAILSLGRQNLPFYADGFLRAAVQAEAALFAQTGAVMAVTGFNLVSYLSTRLARIPLATAHGGSFVPPVLDWGLCPAPVNPPMPSMSRLPAVMQRWLANHVPRWLKAPVRQLNRIADEFGIPHLPGFMALMCGDLTMVTDVPEVLGVPSDDLQRWQPWRGRLWRSTTFRYTGPLFATLDVPVSPRVETFLQGSGACVYVAPTSVDAQFLRALVGAVAASGARVLVGATIHDVKDLESARVMVEGVLPNHVIMKRVAAGVIMGGQGSVHTAMACGMPFVGMPHHGEQELNVALAETQGVAIRVSPRRAGTPDMTAAVMRLIAEPHFRRNAERVRQYYDGIDGADGCARAILEYLDAATAAAPRSRVSFALTLGRTG